MYPMRCDNVQLLICEDEFGTKSYYAVNAAGEEFSVSYPVFKALRHADGTRPLRLPMRMVQGLCAFLKMMWTCLRSWKMMAWCILPDWFGRSLAAG